MYPCSTKTREVLGNLSPTPKRFPETWEILRVEGNLEDGGDGFPNTSRVLVEYGHSPHHQSIYRDYVCLLLVSFCRSVPPEFLRSFFLKLWSCLTAADKSVERRWQVVKRGSNCKQRIKGNSTPVKWGLRVSVGGSRQKVPLEKLKISLSPWFLTQSVAISLFKDFQKIAKIARAGVCLVALMTFLAEVIDINHRSKHIGIHLPCV